MAATRSAGICLEFWGYPNSLDAKTKASGCFWPVTVKSHIALILFSCFCWSLHSSSCWLSTGNRTGIAVRSSMTKSPFRVFLSNAQTKSTLAPIEAFANIGRWSLEWTKHRVHQVSHRSLYWCLAGGPVSCQKLTEYPNSLSTWYFPLMLLMVLVVSNVAILLSSLEDDVGGIWWSHRLICQLDYHFHWIDFLSTSNSTAQRWTSSFRFQRAGSSLGVGGDAVAGVTGGSSLAGRLERRLLIAWLIAAWSPPPIKQSCTTSTINSAISRLVANPILIFGRPIFAWPFNKNVLVFHEKGPIQITNPPWYCKEWLRRLSTPPCPNQRELAGSIPALTTCFC